MKIALSLLFLMLSSLLASAEYILAKDDTISVKVFQEGDLTTQAQIGKSGEVSFPLIGSVLLAGKTLKEAELEIKSLYERDYLVSAQVNISITSYARKWVIMGGDVSSPGTLDYPEEGALDLRGAIAQSGGLSESADSSRIIIRSKSGDVNIYSLKNSGGKILHHGDNITVSRSTLSQSTITMTGNIASPGIVEFPKTGKLDIITAIAKSGGLNGVANKKEVILRRGGKRYVINLRDIERGNAKMFYMQPGDILTIQESRW